MTHETTELPNQRDYHYTGRDIKENFMIKYVLKQKKKKKIKSYLYFMYIKVLHVFMSTT